MRPKARFLTDRLIEQILEEALTLLETRGIGLNHDLLLSRFGDRGCTVNDIMTSDAGDFTLPSELCGSAE